VRVAAGLLLLAAGAWAGTDCPFCGRETFALVLPGTAATRHVCRYCPGVVHAYEDGRTLCSFRAGGRRTTFPLAGGSVVGCPESVVTVATLPVVGPGAALVAPSPPVSPGRAPVERPRPPLERPGAPLGAPAAAVTLPGHAVTMPGFPVTRPGAPVGLPGAPVGPPAPPVEPPCAPQPTIRIVVCTSGPNR